LACNDQAASCALSFVTANTNTPTESDITFTVNATSGNITLGSSSTYSTYYQKTLAVGIRNNGSGRDWFLADNYTGDVVSNEANGVYDVGADREQSVPFATANFVDLTLSAAHRAALGSNSLRSNIYIFYQF
jgi:hypothetical protein